MIRSMSMRKPTFSFISLGCARTLVDSEQMIDRLRNTGFQLVPEGQRETVTVLNTCSFIQVAIDETEQNIRTLSDRKHKGHIQYLAVVGCYPSRFKKDQLQAKFPQVDVWLTTHEKSKIQEALTELVFQRRFSPGRPVPYTKLTPSHYSYLKISEGCNNWCSFCTIPKIRGVHRSKPLDQVIQEAVKQIEMGAQELLLIAEDTTAWGEDLYGKPSFPLLLKELAQLPVKWIRPMYIFPSRVNDELIEVMASSPDKFGYIDMPIQHVSTDLLSAMKRRHDKAFLERIISRFYDAIPNLSLRTTLILGFPGETDAQVEELADFIQKYPFSHIGAFGYSPERETVSYRMEGRIDPQEIQRRIHRVMDLQFELVQHRNAARVGQVVECVYEGNGIARSYREAPQADAVICVSGAAVDSLKPGQFFRLRLTGVREYDLLGAAA